jgi:hypothetical protein
MRADSWVACWGNQVVVRMAEQKDFWKDWCWVVMLGMLLVGQKDFVMVGKKAGRKAGMRALLKVDWLEPLKAV